MSVQLKFAKAAEFASRIKPSFTPDPQERAEGGCYLVRAIWNLESSKIGSAKGEKGWIDLVKWSAPTEVRIRLEVSSAGFPELSEDHGIAVASEAKPWRLLKAWN